MQEKYAVYLRKSREDREKEKHSGEDTLKRHREILTNHAARAGLFIAQTYEEVVSGETIAARPQLQQLITDCYAGKYRGILVVEVSRLSRGNQGDAQTILDCLRYANNNSGLLVITPTKVYDVAHNPDDEEYMEFELFMSRREYKMINKRLDRGRKQAVVEGEFMASYRPYGYDILKTNAYRTLVPNPQEAPIVKMIFEWAKNNTSAGKIARLLTSMGVPTYTGTAEWNQATIKTILENPTYIGKVRWNDRMVVKTMVDGKLVKSRPRSNHTDQFMLYDGLHKEHALVDEETFKLVGSRIHANKTRNDFSLKSPLAGLLYCEKCGKAMEYHSYSNKKGAVSPRYIHTYSQRCKVKSAVATDVINAVAYSLRMYIEEFEVKVNNIPDVDKASVESQIDAMQKEIRKLEKRLTVLFEAWEDGTITNNEFVERKAANNDKIESIQFQMKTLEESIPSKEEYKEKVFKLSQALESLTDNNISAEARNEYLKGLIERINFSRENNEEFILDITLR